MYRVSTRTQPRKGKRGPGRPWTKGAEPPAPEEYTWKNRLILDHPFECADGRQSHLAVNVHFEEHQVSNGTRELLRRDSLSFTVPGSDRTFVWLCDVSNEAGICAVFEAHCRLSSCRGCYETTLTQDGIA